MKKAFIKALAFATLALALVFTAGSAANVSNEEIIVAKKSDAPNDRDIVT